MKIGVIGMGGIGSAFAGHVAKAGYELIISNSRGPETLLDVAEKLGPNVKAGSVKEAATADIIFLSVTWPPLKDIATTISGNGKIVIDATNPFLPNFQVADLGGKTSSEVVSSWIPGAKVVKAFNTLATATLAADPAENGGSRVMFYSGNDAGSKAIVADIISRIGFAGIDLGSLADGGKLQQFPGGSLATLNLIKL